MKISPRATATFFLGAMLIAAPAHAKKKKSPTTAPATQPVSSKTPEEIEAQYAQSLDKRATAIVTTLNIDDTAKAARVHDLLVAQYRAIKDWHDTNDAARKTADPDQAKEIDASYQALHDHFLAGLTADLTPDQIEAVEDALTVKKVEVTYKAYLQIIPNLTDEDKAMILKLLKEARDHAIDDRNMPAKSATFKIYKGKINNYLNAHGHDVTKAYHDWGQAQKAKPSANNPATEPVD